MRFNCPVKLTEELPEKFSRWQRDFAGSSRKSLIQNLYDGMILNVRKSTVNMHTNRVRGVSKVRGAFDAPGRNRAVPKEERELFADFAVYLLYYEMERNRIRRIASEIAGSARRNLKVAGNFDPEIDGDEDPNALSIYNDLQRELKRAKDTRKQSEPFDKKAKVLREWLKEMVVPYRNKRDQDEIAVKQKQIIMEEQIRERARLQARAENEKLLGDETQSES